MWKTLLTNDKTITVKWKRLKMLLVYKPFKNKEHIIMKVLNCHKIIFKKTRQMLNSQTV